MAVALGASITLPGALRSQEPPTRADSIARSDSIARADSILLQGELARIRGERVRTAKAPAGASDSVERTPLRAPRFRAGGAITVGTAYVEDEAGVIVRPSVGGAASVEAVWVTGARYTAGLGLRGGANVAVIAADRRRPGLVEIREVRGAGTVVQLDLVGSLERTVSDRLAVRLGAGGSWTRGPSNIVPFRYGNNGRIQPTGEIGGVVRLARTHPLYATVTVQGSRFGNATVGDPIRTPGWLTRGLIGVRYGR